MPTPRVTESLRRQWQSQRAQLAEELASGHFEDGRAMTPANKKELQGEIDWMDTLLALPLRSPIPRPSMANGGDGAPTSSSVKSWAPEPSAADLRSAILQAVGAASMCWETVAGAGVFQDDQALAVAEGLEKWIADRFCLARRPT